MLKHVRTKNNTWSCAIQVLVLICFLLLPLITQNPFYLRIATEMLIYGLLAMSLDVLLGFIGLISFMHATYMGIGAYTVAIFLTHVDPGAPLWLTFFLGVSVTLLLAFLVGWLQVRTGGFAFALLTVAFGMMFFTIVWKMRSITNGDDGMFGLARPDIAIGPLVLGSMNNYVTAYLFTFCVIVACFVLTRRIMRSPFGSVLESIRENPERASFIGIDVRKYKLLGWLLACGLAGVAGVLFTYLKGSVSPSMMDATAGGVVLMMTLLGGAGTLWGAFIGAAVFIVLQDLISTITENWMVFLGLSVVLLVLFLPKGLVDLPMKLAQKFNR